MPIVEFIRVIEMNTCTWSQDGDYESDTYATACGHYFIVTDGTPFDNKMKFCCFCGLLIEQILLDEEKDENT